MKEYVVRVKRFDEETYIGYFTIYADNWEDAETLGNAMVDNTGMDISVEEAGYE
jgi:hypothetical protein